MTPLFRRPWARPRLPLDHDEAAHAKEVLARAQADLEATKARTPLITALGRSLRDLREENHFRASFEATFRGSNQ